MSVGVATKFAAVFGDDRDPVVEQPPFAHVLARFAQIRTLRFMTVGVVVLGFALLGWGLSLNLFLAQHFHVSHHGSRSAACRDRGSRRALRHRWSASSPAAVSPAAPGKVACCAAAVLVAFSVSVIGLWMPNVALLAVCEAIGFVGVCGALAALPPVVHAVIPPHMRGQGGAAFTNSMFVGASAGAGGDRRTDRELRPPNDAHCRSVPLGVAIGAGLMALRRLLRGAADMRRVVEELREERSTFDLIAAGVEVPMLQVRNLDFSYGTVQVLFDIISTSARARRSPYSARTAPGSRPCCA